MSEEQSSTYEDFDFNEFQRQVIAEFRANSGHVGGMFEGSRLALLTTVGAKSGKHRTSPLAYLEIDGQPLVVASAMGAPTNPAWYHNIRKHPMVTVETGAETYEAIAAIPPGAERDQLFDKVVEQDPGFGEYQAKTTRTIPVVTLHRVDAESADRVRGMGDFLVESHDWLRTELQELRRQLDQIIDGGADGTVERPSPDLGQQLRTHCLSFCTAVEEHHTGEDAGAFPMLAGRFPALAPTLADLVEEHKTVARLQQEIQQLVAGYVPGESDPTVLRDRLERLASDLEAHFAYEERTIVTALNAIGPAPDIP